MVDWIPFHKVMGRSKFDVGRLALEYRVVYDILAKEEIAVDEVGGVNNSI